MYRLQWCGRDGNLRFLDFKRLENAVREGLWERHFFDGVDIVDPTTGEPVELI